MIRVSAPHFVAGVVLDATGTAVRAAPILGYMVGWPGDRVRAYAARRGWHTEALP